MDVKPVTPSWPRSSGGHESTHDAADCCRGLYGGERVRSLPARLRISGARAVAAAANVKFVAFECHHSTKSSGRLTQEVSETFSDRWVPRSGPPHSRSRIVTFLKRCV